MNRLKDVLPLALLAAAGAGLIVWLIARGGTGAPSPLVAVPEDTFLVMTLDVRSFAGSPLAEAFVGKDGKQGAAGRVLGVDAITESCGFNPLTRLRAIAVAVPEGGEGGDFGVAASGEMTRAELTKCAEVMIAKRGGHAKVGTMSTFTVVEDENAPNDGSPSPKVAFRDGGPFLVGRGPWLSRMIDTAEGRVPAIEKNVEHASIRRALDARDASARAIVLTAVLPKSLRDRLRAEMEGEAKDAPGNQTMAGVLGVASAGASLRAGAAGTDTWAYAELRCESADACGEVDKLIAKKRFSWSRDFGIRLVGLGPMIDNIETHPDPQHATTLLVSTHAPTEAIVSALDRALGQRRPRPASPTSPFQQPPHPSPLLQPPPPDEAIRPLRSRDGGAPSATNPANSPQNAPH